MSAHQQTTSQKCGSPPPLTTFDNHFPTVLIKAHKKELQDGNSWINGGSTLFFFVIKKIQDIQCNEIMLSAQESSEGVAFFVHNGTEKVSLHVLTHRKLSQEKESNMVIDYVNNSHALLYIALSGSIGLLEIVERNEINPEFSPYVVHDVIPGGGESGNELCRDVMEWLKRKNLKYANSGLKAKVSVGISLRKMGGESSWIGKDKRFDGGIVSESENYPLVQIEVESSRNEESTIMKLMYGLIDQLRYYKNKGVLISEVSGFFIPVKPGYFKKVVCSWNDAKLTYIRKCISLRKEELYPEIRDAFKNQEVDIDDVFSTELVFPLSREFVKHARCRTVEIREFDSYTVL